MTLKEAIGRLELAGIDEPRLEARQIFRHIGKIPSYMLVGNPDKISSGEVDFAVERRCKREPLQYIIGEVDFYRESYRVTPDCLIPRQDTELLVDYAVRNIPCGKKFLDLCTGSGCVAISTLKNTKQTYAVGYDISKGAIELARENAERNGVSDRLRLVRADLMSSVADGDGVFAVLSNPPYVSEKEYEELQPEIAYEPTGAFVGGADGGDFYRKFIPDYKDIIADEGFIAFEIGCKQGALMRELSELWQMKLEIISDIEGRERVAVFRKK